MNSSEDMTLRNIYLKRLVGALNALNKPTASNAGNKEEVARSARDIKVAADVSLALTVNQTAWSRALLNRISGENKNRLVLRKIVRLKKFQALIAQKTRRHSRLKRTHMISNEFRDNDSKSLYRLFCSKRMDSATSSPARQVRKLKSLVPGGKSMDTSCLLGETADYIASLTIQVDALKYLVISANNTEHPV
ncbi:hypothetical protein SUGI_0202400 [Cryptomeria japonica]|uniref:transcription factor bHLH147 n=1 Tax=Cryptomeria japonica TaxID=3369 RepID=UPI002408DB85|nr:transcription factor bHLH147 [Cryptomeria japonica]GLJ12989.1 hypothetical protein SUGI_0202400 [Cryptomeria japonica]